MLILPYLVVIIIAISYNRSLDFDYQSQIHYYIADFAIVAIILNFQNYLKPFNLMNIDFNCTIHNPSYNLFGINFVVDIADLQMDFVR